MIFKSTHYFYILFFSQICMSDPRKIVWLYHTRKFLSIFLFVYSAFIDSYIFLKTDINSYNTLLLLDIVAACDTFILNCNTVLHINGNYCSFLFFVFNKLANKKNLKQKTYDNFFIVFHMVRLTNADNISAPAYDFRSNLSNCYLRLFLGFVSLIRLVSLRV